jgi:hypothetical protein
MGRKLTAATLGALLATCAPLLSYADAEHEAHYRHVLLISIDGMQAVLGIATEPKRDRSD